MWKGLGAYLGVPQNDIERIAHCKEQTDTTRCQCLTAIFNYWKAHQTDRQPCWNDLIAAVKNIDEGLARTMVSELTVQTSA